jgi:hypothetical protein
MNTKRSSFLVHWTAILAILMSSLAPSISQALAPKRFALNQMDFVCTTSGMQLISEQTSVKPAPAQQSNDHQVSMDDHCPYCALHGNFVLPLNRGLNFELPQSSNVFTEPFYNSPKPLFAWLILPSRAPPTIW